jgi:hypothetical protein
VLGEPVVQIRDHDTELLRPGHPRRRLCTPQRLQKCEGPQFARQPAAHQRGEVSRRRGGDRQRVAAGKRLGPVRVPQRRGEQRVLPGGVAVQRALAEVQGIRDILHLRAAEAVLDEHPGGGGNNRLEPT